MILLNYYLSDQSHSRILKFILNVRQYILFFIIDYLIGKVIRMFKKFILYFTQVLVSVIILFLLTDCSDKSTNNDDNFSPDTTGMKFEPPDGECLFILGQADEEEMDAYIETIDSSRYPAAFAFYTSLSGSAAQNDMAKYKAYLEKYPYTALQLAIWTGEKQWGDPGYYLDDILNGQHDSQISVLANACKSINRPIFIRFGYEFDGSHNAYPPDKYVAAYKYFVDKMHTYDVTNVAYVWHSWGVSPYYGTNDYPQYYPDLPDSVEMNQALWYPGDDYVDWVAMSIFGTGWGDLSTNTVVQWLVNFAEDHDKPVMLAETAAIKTSGQSDPNWVIPNTVWFDNVFALINNNNSVKAFTYINVDWEAANPSSTWGDTRIQAAPFYIIDYWRNKIAPFVHADEEFYSIINYEE
jgi:hypothetical protein